MEKMKEDNIITTIVNLMENVESRVVTSGLDKKISVMNGSKLILGDQIFSQHEKFISVFIDFVIHISKGEIKLNLNNIKKKYCFF
jgi:hypothetical protein